MMDVNQIAAIGVLLLGFNCFFLVCSPDYDDGVVGRLALLVIAGMCFLVGFDIFWTKNGNVSFQPVTATLLWGVLIFIVRHTRRYLQALHCELFGVADRTGLRRRNDTRKVISNA